MKTLRLSLAFIAASFAFAGLAQADDHTPAGKPAKCCEKSSAEGKSCTHGCCVEAAKGSKNCEKCGGKNAARSEKTS